MNASERAQLERRVRAKAVAEARKRLAFQWHALTFVLINALLVVLNLLYTPSALWFFWSLLGWGIALAFHAFATFKGPHIDEDEIEAAVQRELARRGVVG